MLHNAQLIEKLDQTLATITDGKMNPEQEKRFYRVALERTALMRRCTVKRMTADTYQIPRAAIDGTVLQPADEGVALPAAGRSTLTVGKAEITTVELIGEVHITDSTLEDNIEGAEFENTVIALIGEAVGRDLERLLIRGDTATVIPDPQIVGLPAYKLAKLLKTKDGLIKLTTSHTVDALGSRLNKNVLNATKKTMPVEFRDMPNMAFFTSSNAVDDYWNTIVDRQTAMGDAAYNKTGEAPYAGKIVVPVPLWPYDGGVGGDRTSVLMCDPKNIWVGIHRNIRMERDRSIRSREDIIVYTVRWGWAYRYEPETVLTENVQNSPSI